MTFWFIVFVILYGYSALGLTMSRPNGTINVYVGFYVESLSDVREHEMSYDVDIYFRRSWQDPQLRHRNNLRILSNQDELRGLWIPDLYFANAKLASYDYVTVPNFVAYIEEDGTLSFSTRVHLTVACNLQLRDYPLDSQTCYIRILSYGFTNDLLNISWFLTNPVSYNPDINLPEFYIDGLSSGYCNGSYMYSVTKDRNRTGNFSCLLASLYLKRRIGYHVVQTYVPTAMIVMISWVSFWIDRTAVPARVSLSFLTLLTLSTLGSGLRYALPRVSYAKSIDYWYGTCMIFVFSALIEFALVNSLMRRSKKYEAVAEGSRRVVIDSDLENSITEVQKPCLQYVHRSLYDKAKVYSRTALHIDLCCRIGFPSAFIAFNIGYWIYYLN